MSNVVHCSLKVTGAESDVSAFAESAARRGSEGYFHFLCMESFIPYPEELRKQEEDLRQHDGVSSPQKDVCDEVECRETTEWCFRNWGTDWIWMKSVKARGDELVYKFESPWHPPVKVVKEMSRQFPTLDFTLEYYSGDSGFAGRMQCKGGLEPKHLHDDAPCYEALPGDSDRRLMSLGRMSEPIGQGSEDR